jgi:hypothetical protein
MVYPEINFSGFFLCEKLGAMDFVRTFRLSSGQAPEGKGGGIGGRLFRPSYTRKKYIKILFGTVA